MTDEKSFLSRWSQRKAVETKRPTKEETTDSEMTVEMTPDPVAEKAVEPVEETAADPLPDIESLGKDSDYTGFMKEGVPDQLRKLALRKLWQSDPAFAFRDGLDDYDEDFNLAEGIVEQIKTSYRAGSGYEEDDPEKEGVPDADGEAAGTEENADDVTEEGDSAQSANDIAENSPDTSVEEVPDRGKA